MADDRQPSDDQPMRVDASLVRELAELLAANNLNEIEVADGDRKIKVVRQQEYPAGYGFTKHEISVGAGSPGAAAMQPARTAAPAASVLATPVEPADAPVDVVKSPMVGTAFLSAEPGGKPFIAPGDTVKAGDTLLIVEAMKVMNPILATKGGTVRQLLVADAQPVEFDQPLVIFE